MSKRTTPESKTTPATRQLPAAAPPSRRLTATPAEAPKAPRTRRKADVDRSHRAQPK